MSEIIGYGVFESYRFEVLPVVRRTDCFVTVRDSRRDRRRQISGMVAMFDGEDPAKLLAERLTSAKAEKDRRIQSAAKWFVDEKVALIARAKGSAS